MIDNYSKTINEASLKVKNLLETKKGILSIVALTGSGISKGSGVPTFRGTDGLWKNYNVMDLATPQAFHNNPKLIWDWYSWRIELILTKEPNAAHKALVTLQQKELLKWVITQNVDNLHQRAGSTNILKVHGDIFHAWCQKCSETIELKVAPKTPPICTCGNFLRPGVIWFGESLDRNVISKAYEILTTNCDILLVIGTSGLVYPVADFPFIAKSNDALVIEFNLEKTPISQFTNFSIFGKSEETLPLFVECLFSDKQ
ncbi:MAG: NAD-dependent deacylase [Candidatus Heimdallarchaeota archaeon]|nr:NAD-dependent deacylase [Candidatus Heimdallarchaeota archaeon]